MGYGLYWAADKALGMGYGLYWAADKALGEMAQRLYPEHKRQPPGNLEFRPSPVSRRAAPRTWSFSS